ncbi:hypothetical protein HWV62_27965 [Athelia sp. TMB]|nr:hypothetical protein HWV62_27965 [Athelia sp. TMB]
MSVPSSTPPPKGWHTRALTNPHPDPHNFTPSFPNLRFAMLRDAQVGDSFTLALFSQSSTSSSEATFASASSPSEAVKGKGESGVAIDAMGQVLNLSREDWATFMGLVEQLTTSKLLQPKSSISTWMVAHSVSCRPIEELFAPAAEGGLGWTRVAAFSASEKRLSEPNGNATVLPDVLFHLVRLGLEGREGYIKQQQDQVVISKVKSLLEAHF